MKHRDHMDAADCWCRPYLYFTAPNGAEVWVHRAEDGREPPVALMLEACEAAALGVSCDPVETA